MPTIFIIATDSLGNQAQTTRTFEIASSSGVVINQGQNPNTVMAAHPNGTRFLFAPGTWSGFTLLAKPGVEIAALDPADPPVFNGGGRQWFVDSAGASSADVKLTNVKWTNYWPANPSWVGVSGSEFRKVGGVRGPFLPDAVLVNCEAYGNGTAVNMGDGMLIQNGFFHDNHQMNLYGNGRGNFQIIGGEWARANIRPDGQNYYKIGWESGGNKFATGCHDFLIDGVESHHNGGAGIWADGEGQNGTIRNCFSHDNAKAGIFWELSRYALIEDNESRNNFGFGNIYVSDSQGTSAKPILVQRNLCGSNQLGLSIALQGDGNRSIDLGYVTVKDNTVEGGMRMNIINGHPAPVGIVVSNNRDPQGNLVGLS